ncbi:LCP family protein [Leptothermofonsia sichuanensis]|uniref:LCP family protein n=1 Tax=Leptothermofonsia sichuanensis TaxID=2917832 RepID=UPI001CEDE8E7|nr:LCP family protein [Leptothermofonsia sichuanensis]
MTQIESRTKAHQSNVPDHPHRPPHAATSAPSITPPGKSRSLADWVFRGLMITVAATASATLGLAVAMLTPLPTGLASSDKDGYSLDDLWQNGFQYKVARPVNILVMGIDRVLDTPKGAETIFDGRSDTMLLVRVDPAEDAVMLLSIPRDTQVEIPGVGLTKVNDANVRGGPELAAKTVSSTLNGVQIDRYVRVSTDAFRELVDLLGGVEVYVPRDMSYEDRTQKLKIDLKQGQQTLNGDQAEQFARFRYDDLGDIGRVQRQQVLLKALLKRLTNPMVIPRLPSLVTSMQKYIDTNLTMEEMLALVGAGRKLSQGNFKMVMLPGRFSTPNEFIASYWIMDPAGRDRVMQQYFKLDPIDTTREHRPATALRIAIQNASTNPEAAHQMRRHLTRLGFYNVYIAPDWANHQRQTQIVVQQGDLSAAEELKNLLGMGTVEANSTGDLESDLTVRVGDDWKAGSAE